MSFYYGSFWDYWELRAPVTFDGVHKQIIVNEGETDIDIRDDVWSRWVDWLGIYDNSKYGTAVRFSGLDPIPGGYTGDVYFLTNGWRLIVDLNKVKITGILYSDDYETAFYDPNLTPLYPAKVSSLVNVVETPVNVVTGDISSVAAQVWSYMSRTLTSANLTAADVWSHPTRELTAIDVGAVASAVEATLADEFSNITIDTNAIATAVRAALAVELARIDANISSRHAAGVTIPANLKQINDTVITGSGSPGNKWRPA